ncbi:hypothetical protein OC835_005484 [Tilletia horrida]|uniref:Shq1 C-terminal domain-containing protein n=1 Tax=Tilletia horrida TaxID=155126 RepID=A0AAN6JM99_9BASI|nr:hypothetical protein OC835_005484 [Tilletia horrida]KAK0537190.1 hypothetical protein OC842_001711 [Tilletia horrida]
MAASPGGSTTVPSYNLSQDDHTIQVRIHCPLAPPNSQPNVVSDGQAFGFTCPKMGRHSYYLPLYLPMPVHSPVLVRDPATSALVVTLRKSQPGVHVPDLVLLQPSIHPDIPFVPELLGGSAPGSATPGSPADGLESRQSYISAEAAAMASEGTFFNTGGGPSPALSPQLPSAPSAAFPVEEQPSEDPEVSQAADELIALGLKNENERRRAQGQSPLILATGAGAADKEVRGEPPLTFSHVHESSEASTISSSVSTEQDDLADISISGTDAGVRDAIAAAAQSASPSPGKTHPYGFRGAFTGTFLPQTSISGSGPASVASSAASTVESASGVASPMCVRSKVHELQQDVRRLAWSKRRKVAKLREEEKWDEGRYLDGYVDEFGEVAEILAWEPEKRLEVSAAAVALSAAVESDEPQPLQPFDKTSREAHLAALQFLFAYGYDWRTTQGEHNVESEWTLSVLCRSLVTQCPIEPASPIVPRAISPSGSTGTTGMNSSSADLATIGMPRAVSPVSSLSGTHGAAYHHQPLDGAIFGNAGSSVTGTPTLRGASPDPIGSYGSGAIGSAIPMSMAGSSGVSSFGSSGAVATLGRRPGSSEAVGSPPGAPFMSSPAMSSSLSGSLAAPRRASGLSVSGIGPGGVEYGMGVGGAGGAGVPSSGPAGGRGKLPVMRDEPEYDTPLTILRASYRRALTFPLHRSWALCDKVRDDVLAILRAGLKEVGAALLLMEDRLTNSDDSAMHRYAEVWVRPVREWLENHGSDHSLALLAAEIEFLSSELTRDLVGGEVWDLELLEAAARDALEEGHGGYG